MLDYFWGEIYSTVVNDSIEAAQKKLRHRNYKGKKEIVVISQAVKRLHAIFRDSFILIWPVFANTKTQRDFPKHYKLKIHNGPPENQRKWMQCPEKVL